VTRVGRRAAVLGVRASICDASQCIICTAHARGDAMCLRKRVPIGPYCEKIVQNPSCYRHLAARNRPVQRRYDLAIHIWKPTKIASAISTLAVAVAPRLFWIQKVTYAFTNARTHVQTYAHTYVCESLESLAAGDAIHRILEVVYVILPHETYVCLYVCMYMCSWCRGDKRTY
jgi:hypothetical protein